MINKTCSVCHNVLIEPEYASIKIEKLKLYFCSRQCTFQSIYKQEPLLIKRCSKCKIKKPLHSYYADIRTFGGFFSACKKCHSKGCLKWQKNNTDFWTTYQQAWKNNNRTRINIQKKQRRDLIKHTPKYRLDRNLRWAIYHSLLGRKVGRKWEVLVGYTVEELIQHLEQRFDNKMNWDNYGSYWHIDHIKPQSWFRYTTAEDKEFKECWGLNNLQPLEATINISKNNRFIFDRHNL